MPPLVSPIERHHSLPLSSLIRPTIRSTPLSRVLLLAARPVNSPAAPHKEKKKKPGRKDIISEHPERLIVGEIIREKIFMQYRKEIHYACQSRCQKLFRPLCCHPSTVLLYLSLRFVVFVFRVRMAVATSKC